MRTPNGSRPRVDVRVARNGVRVSPSVNNDVRDVERLLAVSK